MKSRLAPTLLGVQRESPGEAVYALHPGSLSLV